MKLSLMTAFIGVVAVSAKTDSAPSLRATDVTVEAEVSTYAPPSPQNFQHLKGLWDELAAEASFMQSQLKEGRTTTQCENQCNNSENVNRARCRRNCGEINDQGNNSMTRTLSCGDCQQTFKSNSRKLERCMTACRDGQVDTITTCDNAFSCSECRRACATNNNSNNLDRCLEQAFNQGESCNDNRYYDGDHNFERCDEAWSCDDCDDMCDNNSNNNGNRNGNRNGNNNNNDLRNCYQTNRCNDKLKEMDEKEAALKKFQA